VSDRKGIKISSSVYNTDVDCEHLQQTSFPAVLSVDVKLGIDIPWRRVWGKCGQSVVVSSAVRSP
jgi:hypothetical protein